MKWYNPELARFTNATVRGECTDGNLARLDAPSCDVTGSTPRVPGCSNGSVAFDGGWCVVGTSPDSTSFPDSI